MFTHSGWRETSPAGAPNPRDARPSAISAAAIAAPSYFETCASVARRVDFEAGWGEDRQARTTAPSSRYDLVERLARAAM
jgi:hypothetical protein